jgi:predicted  nucleic acid-binding Zn-ribbon protein
MSLTRTLYDLESHMDSARDSFYHLQKQVDEIMTEYVKEVAELKNLVESLEEQNTLLEENLEEWKHKCVILEAENLEVTAKFAHYTLSS